MANLGSITYTYMKESVIWLLGKIFRWSNITKPIKFLLNLLFGISNMTETQKLQRDVLKKAWAVNQPESINPIKLLGLPRMLLKSLIFAIAGMVVAILLTLFKRHKFN